MNRRSFMTTVGVGAAAATVAPGINPGGALAAAGDTKLKMHVGTQRGISWRRRRRGGQELSPEELAEQQTLRLKFLERYGVEHICGTVPNPGERGYCTVEELEKARDLYARHGIAMDMLALPFLASSHIDRERRPAIMLGKSPERDRDIEHINIMTANCAKAGIS